jgi:hypothetical protein
MRTFSKIAASELQYSAMDPTYEWFQTQMPGFNVPVDAAPAVSFIHNFLGLNSPVNAK